MPTRARAPIGAPCWIDLNSSDPERARAFYSAVFGWVAGEASAEFGGYFMFLDGEAPIAGGSPKMGDPSAPDSWNVYLCVDDLARVASLAGESGGTLAMAPVAVADLGTMAAIVDASGAAVRAWQPDQFAGFGRYGEVGTPIWFELHTREYARAVSFYETVFGWTTETMSDTPEFAYTVANLGGEPLAGIMDATATLPDTATPQWATFFGVSDVDRTLEVIDDLGGAVTFEPHDSPYGRLAGVADPTGATFSIMAR